MPKLIKNRELSNNPWQRINTAEECEGIAFGEGQWILPASEFKRRAENAEALPANLGIWYSTDTDPATLEKPHPDVQVICIDFPVFTDGRGFTLARSLREYHEFTGDIRATGNFIQDQLFYLSRCGFSSFEVSDDANIDSMLASLCDFTVTYQAAMDEAQPLFRRRS